MVLAWGEVDTASSRCPTDGASAPPGYGVRGPRCPHRTSRSTLLGRPPRIDAWPVIWVRWRDFGLPRSTAEAGPALRTVHERAATGRVEVGCGGGVGRTGCALAALAVLSGLDPAEAVDWVRREHHPRAVETPWQRRWVERAAYLG